jgi:hypothetical protein
MFFEVCQTAFFLNKPHFEGTASTSSRAGQAQSDATRKPSVHENHATGPSLRELEDLLELNHDLFSKGWVNAVPVFQSHEDRTNLRQDISICAVPEIDSDDDQVRPKPHP